MWDMASLGVSCVRFRQLHGNVDRGEGVLRHCSTAQQVDSTRDVMTSR